MARPLVSLEVLVLDCQATGPRGRIVELGWARVTPHAPPERPLQPQSRLVALPEGERLPRRVAQITGLTDRMLQSGVTPIDAFREMVAAAAPLARGDSGAPTVIHFAQFEAPFLADLGIEAGIAPPFDVVCAHAVARRLLPDLPRRTLRALAGYFGLAVAAPRRCADHVEATAFVWQRLLSMLADREGVQTWEELRDFLRAPAKKGSRRAYPMPPEVRLGAPDRPGLYRMLRVDGSVLYVGKATSLSARVNSYFRRQSGGPERTLEMLSQARGLSMTSTESALEAALEEPDEIKRLRPPYNVALVEQGRAIWFATPDLQSEALRPDRVHTVGPFLAPSLTRGAAALAEVLARGGRADPARILGIPDRYAPSPEVFAQGLDLFVSEHGLGVKTGIHAIMALGSRLWGEGFGREEPEEEDTAPPATEIAREVSPADVARALARLVVMASHAIRRAVWVAALVDCSVVWNEPTASTARLLILERGVVTHRGGVSSGALAPVPPGCDRSASERRHAMDIAVFDRLRVLTTEIRRVVAEGHPAEIRFDARRALSGERVRRALSWV